MKHLILSPPEKAASLTTKFVFYFLGSSHFPFSFLLSPQIIFLEGCTQHCTLFLTKFCREKGIPFVLDLQRQLICNPTFMHQVLSSSSSFFFCMWWGFDRLQINHFLFLRIWLHVPSQIHDESTCLY